MKRNAALFSLATIGLLAAAGCATSMHGSQAKTQEADAVKTQVAALETRIDELNQRIEDVAQRQQVAQAQVSAYSAAKRQIARSTAADGTEGKTKLALAAGTTLSAKQTQLALKSAGFYNGQVDGKFGAQTKDAVKAFQRSKGLNPDGVVGSKTAAALAKLTTAESAGSTDENQ